MIRLDHNANRMEVSNQSTHQHSGSNGQYMNQNKPYHQGHQLSAGKNSSFLPTPHQQAYSESPTLPDKGKRPEYIALHGQGKYLQHTTQRNMNGPLNSAGVRKKQ